MDELEDHVQSRALASSRSSDFARFGSNEAELVAKLRGLEERSPSNSDVTTSLTPVVVGCDRNENILIAKERS